MNATSLGCDDLDDNYFNNISKFLQDPPRLVLLDYIGIQVFSYTRARSLRTSPERRQHFGVLWDSSSPEQDLFGIASVRNLDQDIMICIMSYCRMFAAQSRLRYRDILETGSPSGIISLVVGLGLAE